MNKVFRILLATTAIFCCTSAFSQNKDIWSIVRSHEKNILLKPGSTSPVFQLQLENLKETVRLASGTNQSHSFKTSAVIVSFPTGTHTNEQFRIVERAVLSDALAKKFPNIKSYIGVNIEDPLQKIYFSIDLLGFHGLLRNYKTGKTTYINPTKNNDNTYYLANKANFMGADFHCRVDGSTIATDTADKFQLLNRPVDDSTLRTYRLALACSGEYAQFQIDAAGVNNGTDTEKKAAVLSAMNTTLTRVNSVYENDLAISLQLVDNNENIIFLNPETDGISNDDSTTIINNEIQNIIDSNIGFSNYDIGHVFTKTASGGDGVAQLASVCTSSKARGVTGYFNPAGDSFDIDFVAHEMGHQFGATHTFNNSCDSNRTSATAVEPGSGSTIMGYAGICPDNVQGNSDPYFHAISISQIWDNITQGNSTCASTTPINNQAPVIASLSSYTIPASTPFVLDASVTDADGDALTYCWEQQNNEISAQPPVADANGGPSFRSKMPSSSSKRFFPSEDALFQNNLATTWEVIPTVSRNLYFSLLVRDNNAEGGQTARSDLTVSTVNTGAAFEVTSQTTAQTLEGGAVYNVTWNVAGTDEIPIKTDFVDIYLIIDNDLENPMLLTENTKNDGAKQVVVPGDLNSNNARIMVKASNNVFFALNKATLQITPANYALLFDSLEYSICQPDALNIPFTYNTYNGFNETTTFSASDVPAGLNVSFSDTQANTDDTEITINITGTENLNSGNNSFTVVATASGGDIKEYPIDLAVYSNTMDSATLASPANASTEIPLNPIMSWEDYPNAGQFEIQLSTASDFSTIVASEVVNSTEFQPTTALEETTTYYWRVKPINACGEGSYSNAFSFTTVNISCTSYSNPNTVSISASGSSSVSSSINFFEAGTINDVRVTVDITHSWVGDLTISLVSPSGTIVPLLVQQCGNKADINATFTDEGNTISCAFSSPTISGNVLPQQALSVLQGEPTKGIWKLKVDDSNDGDGGSINDFQLDICINGDFMEDADQDGVLDSNDLCPNTPLGAKVDVNGCELFSIAPNNYSIVAQDESCIDSNNGNIDIVAENTTYTYTANLSGNGVNVSANFNENTTFNSLSAGSYSLCFTVAEDTTYEQCFTINISEPVPLSVISRQTTGHKISLQLSGSDTYIISLNDEEFQTNRSEVELTLKEGINSLKVYTKATCQGSFEHTFVTPETIRAYPNPFNEKVHILTAFPETEYTVSLFDMSGKHIKTESLKSDASGKITLEAGTLPSSSYVLKVWNKSLSKTVKLLKR